MKQYTELANESHHLKAALDENQNKIDALLEPLIEAAGFELMNNSVSSVYIGENNVLIFFETGPSSARREEELIVPLSVWESDDPVTALAASRVEAEIIEARKAAEQEERRRKDKILNLEHRLRILKGECHHDVTNTLSS